MFTRDHNPGLSMSSRCHRHPESSKSFGGKVNEVPWETREGGRATVSCNNHSGLLVKSKSAHSVGWEGNGAGVESMWLSQHVTRTDKL